MPTSRLLCCPLATSLFVLALITMTFLAMTNADDAPASCREVKVTRTDEKIRVEIGGKLFTEYLHQGQRKPVLFPVIGPGETPMTRNYPMVTGVAGEATDHPHQRSLWFTHGDVNGVDFWSEGGRSGKIELVEIVETRSGESEGRIVTRNRWVAPDGKAILSDRRTIVFAEDDDGSRVIDYEIRLEADQGDVVFGDTKEGSMGIRTRPELRLKNDERHGVTGAKGKAVSSAGHRDGELWGKRAKWVDYWAPVDGRVVGIAVFDHPTNPMHPTWWHARDYGLVAANPFGVHDFERKPAGTGDMRIAKGESKTFRYRFVFHPGDAEDAKIAERYERWAKEGSR